MPELPPLEVTVRVQIDQDTIDMLRALVREEIARWEEFRPRG